MHRQNVPIASFKELTPENWRERDPTNEVFAHLDARTRRMVPTGGEDWTRWFLSVTLDARVPSDVRDLFAVAQGTLVYGHYFYPLYTLGDEQLHRVADAAAHHRYHELGGPATARGRSPAFATRIRWLVTHGAISNEEAPRWDAYRQLRNIASHPTLQALHTPGDALRSLRLVAASVNQLFRPPILQPRGTM